jgi:hypothetical protein
LKRCDLKVYGVVVEEGKAISGFGLGLILRWNKASLGAGRT